MKFLLKAPVDFLEYHSFFALIPHRCVVCGIGFWLERGLRKMVISDQAKPYHFEYACLDHRQVLKLQ